jgi:hypothetical protein
MPRSRLTALAALLLAAAGLVAATPPAPPPPGTYDVQVRYRIDARRNERVAQFSEMLDTLKKLGFRRNPDDTAPEDEAENPSADRLNGTVDAAHARRLLEERHVRALRLLPHGVALPEAAQPVRVHLDLASGFEPRRQHLLADQVRQALAGLGFAEAVGYDDRGATRLVGILPAGQVQAVVDGLERLPAGARLPATAAAVRVVEALPGVPPPPARPAPPAVPPGQETLTDDLRAALEAKPDRPLRVEVLLAGTPPAGDRSWQVALRQAAPGIALEGLLGSLVTATVPPEEVVALAGAPEVVGVRLPRLAEVASLSGAGRGKDALASTGLDRLQRMGYRGRGTRLAVVGADFRGWEGLAGKQLPAGTRLVDLTREPNRSLEPDPWPQGGGPGHGTREALAALRAAPDAELTLVRIDPGAPYQLLTVARAINGDPARSLALDRRAAEIQMDRAALDRRRDELAAERRQAFADFSEEGEARQRREEYQRHQADFDREERELNARVRRYLDHQKALLGLRGVRVVACPLVWSEGHPVDGTSALSRYFDDRPFSAALWLQAAGGGPGRAWAGPFRDADAGGVMDFAAPDAPLPPRSWSRGLNFLAWRPAGGGDVLDLPAGARVRVSLQWREAHDPEFVRSGEDAFRVPLAFFRLLALRQVDPEGRKQPADDLQVVAESSGLPQRLELEVNAATYEISAEWRVPQAGRYAVRVEGRAPESDRPRSAPTLPALRRVGEVRPRLFVATLEGDGWAVFRDFRTAADGVGVPADARHVTAVGARDGGLGQGPEMVNKPDLYTPEPDGAGVGFAAGAAAASHSAGAPLCGWMPALGLRPGDTLRIPADWPGRGNAR